MNIERTTALMAEVSKIMASIEERAARGDYSREEAEAEVRRFLEVVRREDRMTRRFVMDSVLRFFGGLPGDDPGEASEWVRWRQEQRAVFDAPLIETLGEEGLRRLRASGVEGVRAAMRAAMEAERED